ncbi:tetratricopeptide repeat protein [Chachezhania sediminis]|uniref:tetratricopeptide repeat protein n=1 Tax=Chachezhania sediminis TaxID=2599291 RepID=UPI00131B72BA|nr:tetratricopeptide repeat protein [Chachezhania sediminis]
MSDPATAKLNAALRTADWATAERLLRRAAGSRKADASVHFNLGKVLLEQGRAGAAVLSLRKALAQRPGHSDGWYELGRAALKADDLGTAPGAFARAQDLTPPDTDGRRSLGRVQLKLGRYEDAAQVWAPLKGDAEANETLYRCAAELRAPEAEALLARPGGRAATLKALTRVSNGRVPLHRPVSS